MKRTRSKILVAGFLLALGGRATRGDEPPKQEPPKEGQPAPAGAKEEKGSRGTVVDPMTGKRLNEAVDKIHAQKYGEARAAIAKINMDRLSPYEASRVLQLSAAVDQAEGKYGAARDDLTKAIASGGMNDQEIVNARFQIAQLFMAESKWKEGVEALKQWFATAQNPNSAAYHLLAVAYYQLGDHNAAVEPAQKAVEMAGAKPQEGWLQLLLALRLERQEYKLAAPIVKQLIEANPATKTYWMQLTGVAASLGSYQDAAVPLEVAYRAGLLTEEQDAQRLAQMLIQIAIPYRAAKILSQAVEQGRVKSDAKTNELIANCWIAARDYDKAMTPLRKAADLSDGGELYVRLAEVYVQREDWSNAAGVLRLGIDKGKLKSPGNAKLLMGMAIYNQKKYAEAQSWFQRAREHPESRSQAEAWLRHVETMLPAEPHPETAARPGAASS
ncbi:MAG TPA: tetratricopeptide repeat protein [Candidatus Binatia bacterium]|nr:tetratricopeptide repeat protein [Candidatus Binatia bacterium]